jgi:nucleoside-diphosphate-sugar epimerase
MKALIIGGTGVISYDVALMANNRKIETTLLNRGNRIWRLPRGSSLLVADITRKHDVIEKTKGMQFDVIIDFLSYSSNQVEDTISIFADKCRQFIFISSATVYGRREKEEAVLETDPLLGTEWGYARNKIACEKSVERICKEINLPYTIVRPYVTYGDTRIPFAVISKTHHWSLINRMLCRKPIVVWDDGKAKATLTHSVDFARGLVGLFGNHAAFNTAVHITSDEILSWNDVLSKISMTIDTQPIVINIPSAVIEKELPEYRGELQYDKANTMVFDNSKIKRMVPDFESSIRFEEGIMRTMDYFQSNHEMMIIEHAWDARIDRLIQRYCRSTKGGKYAARQYRLFFTGESIQAASQYFGDRYSVGAFIKHGMWRKIIYILKWVKSQLLIRKWK